MAMTKPATTRAAVYTAALLGFAATVATAFGYGTFDPATGMFDLAPFDVKALAAFIVTGAGNLLALIAVLRGWASK